MENKLTGTSDIYTVCTNESILTIDDKEVGENIKPFTAKCKITGQQCAVSPIPLSAMVGVNSSDIWNKYAQPFGDIDERILLEESYFFCSIGTTKVKITDPAQYNVRVGDSHKIYDAPDITNWTLDSDGFIINDPEIIKNRVIELEQLANGSPGASMKTVDGVVLHRTVNGSAAATFTSFGSLRTTSSGAQYYAGTHFVVGKDGTIYQTANLNIRTNHVSGLNRERVGIEVVGNALDANGQPTQGPPHGNPVASWEALTPEQEAGVAYLTNNLVNHYNLNLNNVEVHEDLEAKTAGEGQTVYDAIVDDLGVAVDTDAICKRSHSIDKLLRINDHAPTGKLVAVDGAVITCPNAVPHIGFPL